MQLTATKANSKTKQGNGAVLSAYMPPVCIDVAYAMMSLVGYDNMSAFVKDAVIEKCQNIAMATTNIGNSHKSERRSQQM